MTSTCVVEFRDVSTTEGDLQESIEQEYGQVRLTRPEDTHEDKWFAAVTKVSPKFRISYPLGRFGETRLDALRKLAMALSL